MHKILIVGAGFAGIGLGIRLRQAGEQDFIILEQADEIGGVWRDNRYPGAACDVPSHLYTFSFAPNPHWSRSYSAQPEIQRYLLACVKDFNLRPQIHFQRRVDRAHFDPAGYWQIESRGQVYSAQVLVLAIGALNRPLIPPIEGLQDFQGPVIHTAQWPEAPNALQDQRVAVVGTGASAIQLVPALQPQVKALKLFQRTAPWVVPKADFAIPPWKQKLYKRLPAVHQLMRQRIFWSQESVFPLLQWESPLSRLAERGARAYLRSQIQSPELQARITPQFTIGCKRILLSNDYYRSLKQENVEVFNTGLKRVVGKTLHGADGTQVEVDAIALATGFRVPSHGAPFPIQGLRHQLQDEWRDAATAYQGMLVAGYPNLIHLMGPNTGTGHTSVIFFVEAQIHYLLQYLNYLDTQQLSYLDLKPQVQGEFNRKLQQRMRHTVWHSGCASWYLAPNGTNTTLWPGFAWEYWLKLRRFKAQEFYKVGMIAGRPQD